MNQSLMTEFKEDLKDFREMTEKFYAKKVSVKDYKGFFRWIWQLRTKGRRGEYASSSYAGRKNYKGEVKVFS